MSNVLHDKMPRGHLVFNKTESAALEVWTVLTPTGQKVGTIRRWMRTGVYAATFARYDERGTRIGPCAVSDHKTLEAAKREFEETYA